MPLLHIHLLADVLLMFVVYFLEKDLRKNYKALGYLFFAIISSNLIDLDHLIANPIYDANRCGINYHFFHSWYLFPVYIFGLLVKNKIVRYFCLGVLLHLWLDWIGCLLI